MPPKKSQKKRKVTSATQETHKGRGEDVGIVQRSTKLSSSCTPSGFTAFRTLLTVRLISALWNNITDCDETYNYWEPTHFLLFGTGFQTWEYMPQYALRSYAYLLTMWLPAWLYWNIFHPDKVLVFYILRCLVGFFCALCEAYFYVGVCKEFGIHVGRLTLVFLVFGAGMFIASTAYLPSSFSMYMCLLSMGAWFQRKDELAVFTTALSTILSWPFAGALGIPIAIDILFRRKRIMVFVMWAALSLAVILVPTVYIDSQLYGRLVIAPLNIVLYNVFSSHGPDLYGTEPVTFYLVNGFLNFNFVFLAALVVGPILYLVQRLLPYEKKDILPYWLSLLPLYLWIIIFFNQPHKEERFLFPIYPLICLGGALTFDRAQKLWYHFVVPNKVEHYLKPTQWMAICIVVVCSLLSVSRILALYRGYHAPIDVFMELNKRAAAGDLPSDKRLVLCYGKEWYRFPSNFFLPDANWEVHFVKSEFRGQLPKPYSSLPNATAIVATDMNDLNQEEPSRYVDVKKCHFLVDLDLPQESEREPRYSHMTSDWKVFYSVSFLDAARSHKLLRAFYIPWLTEEHCSYASYNLLVSTRFRFRRGGEHS